MRREVLAMAGTRDSPCSEVPPLSTGGAFLFVWGVWTLMLAARIVLTAKHGNPSIPLSDEWFLLDTAPQSISLSWLWNQHAEHRVPLAKLIWLGVLRLTDYDFRIGNFVAIFAWGVVAFAMILTAKSVRGRISYCDAFFPLALLNLGQGLNFLWWWTVNQMLAPLVACVLLLIVVARGGELGARFAIATGLLLVVLPLCGPSGLPYVLALAIWLVRWSYCRWSSSDSRDKRVSLLVFGLALLGVILVGCYFAGLSLDQRWPTAERPYAFVKVSVQLLSLSLGTAAGPYWKELGVGVLALIVGCMAVLLVMWVRRPEERGRGLGLLLFMGAVSSLVIVVARARSGMSEDYIFMGTYVPLLVPILCCAYFSSEVYVRPTVGPFVEVSLFAVACALLLGNVTNGVKGAQWISTRSMAMEQELRAGIPRSILAERHLAPEIFHVFAEERVVGEAVQLLGRLQDAGIGVFKHMRREPEMRAASLATTPSTTNQVTWKDGVAYGHAGSSGRSFLVFSLEQTRFVYAVRLRFSYSDTASSWAMFEMLWGTRGRNGFDESAPTKERKFELRVPVDPARKVLTLVDGKTRYDLPTPDRVVTIWVNETIDEFRIYPDTRPCVFRLSEIVLLVPTAGKLSLPGS